MKNRNIKLFFESIFDLETSRRGNVFEVDTAESSGDHFYRAHDLIRILRVQTDRKRVDARELFEQHRLAFHHRHCRCWTNVAETKHCCSVCNDCDGVLLDRQREGFIRIVFDRIADSSDAWRVGHREIRASFQRHLRHHFDLAAEVHEKRRIGDLQQFNAVDVLDSFDDLLAMLTRNRTDGDVANDVVVADCDYVDGADVTASATNRHRQLAERTGTRREPDAQCQTVTRGWCGLHIVNLYAD